MEIVFTLSKALKTRYDAQAAEQNSTVVLRTPIADCTHMCTGAKFVFEPVFWALDAILRHYNTQWASLVAT